MTKVSFLKLKENKKKRLRILLPLADHPELLGVEC